MINAILGLGKQILAPLLGAAKTGATATTVTTAAKPAMSQIFKEGLVQGAGETLGTVGLSKVINELSPDRSPSTPIQSPRPTQGMSSTTGEVERLRRLGLL